MSILSQPYFYDEASAFKFVESVLWPDGPVCPECGTQDRVYPLKGIKGKALLYPVGHEKAGQVRRAPQERIGLYKCGHKECKRQFTVRVGTVFESSHVEMHKWLQAIHLLNSSKKGMSAHQLHRTLEVQYKTALFMWGRIRLAMDAGSFPPFGSRGGLVEIDETYIGRAEGEELTRPAMWHMHRVLTMIDRDTGRARSMVLDDFTQAGVKKVLDENIVRSAIIVTDEAQVYKPTAREFGGHKTVNHKKEEYVSRENPLYHTNTVEGFFSVFKRGMKGVYQHCSKRHLHRYLAEFDFRYSNRAALGVDDKARTVKALQGAKGKRLYYRQPA